MSIKNKMLNSTTFFIISNIAKTNSKIVNLNGVLSQKPSGDFSLFLLRFFLSKHSVRANSSAIFFKSFCMFYHGVFPLNCIL